MDGIPNPDVVHMYLAETGLNDAVEKVHVDVPKGENRQPHFLDINPLGEVPALVLEDGTTISESTSIVKYLDLIHGGSSVVGQTPKDAAIIDMWLRRMEEKIIGPMGDSFRNGVMAKFFQDRRPGCIHPEISEPAGKVAAAGLQWLDLQLADGREFLLGEQFCLADIRFHCMVSFFLKADKKQKIPDACPNVTRYMERLAKRPSALAIKPKPKAKL